MSYFTVHASQNELNTMDALQGYSQRYDGDPRIRIYTNGMEDMLKNQDFRRSLLKYMHDNFATGGHVKTNLLSKEELESYRDAGRNGDNAIALLGPYMLSFMEMAAGSRGSTNPETGLPEFFSLGGLFGGIGNALSSVGNTIWDGVKSVAAPVAHMASGLLPMAGNAIGGLIGSKMGNPALGSSLGGALGGALAPVVNQFGQHVGGGQPGGQPQGNGFQMGDAMQHFGSQMLPQMANAAYQGYQNGGGMGGAMNGMYNTMQQQGPGAAMSAYNMGGGAPAMQQSFNNAMQRYRTNMAPGY